MRKKALIAVFILLSHGLLAILSYQVGSARTGINEVTLNTLILQNYISRVGRDFEDDERLEFINEHYKAHLSYLNTVWDKSWYHRLALTGDPTLLIHMEKAIERHYQLELLLSKKAE